MLAPLGSGPASWKRSKRTRIAPRSLRRARALPPAASIPTTRRRAPVSSYTLTQAEFRSLKARLTRAENRAKASGDWGPVAREARRALALFEEKGFPDSWSRWQRAAEDADYRARVRAAGLR